MNFQSIFKKIFYRRNTITWHALMHYKIMRRKIITKIKSDEKIEEDFKNITSPLQSKEKIDYSNISLNKID